MTWFRNARIRFGSDESGIAMVTVIAVSAVLTMFVVAGIAFAVGGLRQARNDQDWNGALAAAYAAVEDYQSKISNDPSYVRFGDPASTFTSYVDPGDPTAVSSVSLPPVANPAFGLGAAGTWAAVAGSDDSAHFRYEVNNAKYYTDGVITLRATGRVGDVTRSLYADLKQSGFVDYVYFTNYETSDPFNSSSPCYAYAYAGRPSSCREIVFGSSDEIDGPVHSNDRIVIECGATFHSPITTGYNPSSGNKYKQNGSCTPNFFGGVKPTYGGILDMPPTNSEMRKETRYDLPAEVPVPGCLYTGPTSIVFHNDGTMTVTSPWTKKTQVSATGGRDNFAACGRPGTSSGRLGHSSGQRIPVPDNNLIFVQNVPTITTDPNYSSTSTTISLGSRSCRGTVNYNALGYPVSGEEAPPSAYGCRNGDVFVKGTLEGKVTVSSENNVYIVGDVVYDDKDRDTLGLVGQNAVIVWNPMDDRDVRRTIDGVPLYDGRCVLCNDDRTIHAAILSVQHTFMVQNTDHEYGGRRGDLEVYGSIAQMFRGIVSWYSGYDKDYEYDKKFRYTAPPKFLTPASTTYGVSTWVEIKPVFEPDGTYR